MPNLLEKAKLPNIEIEELVSVHFPTKDPFVSAGIVAAFATEYAIKVLLKELRPLVEAASQVLDTRLPFHADLRREIATYRDLETQVARD